MLIRIFLLLLIPVHTLSALPITKHFGRALENASAYDKPIIALFTGSDWSFDSKRLIEQFENVGLQEKLGTGWIVCHLDYPEINTQTQAEVEQNFSLKKKLKIDTIPSIAILSPAGEMVAKTGYLPVDPTFFAKHLAEMYTTYCVISQALKTASVEKLKVFLLDARSLNNIALKKAIIEEGLSREENAVFALEKFQMLKDKTSNEARSLLCIARAGESKLIEKEKERLAWELFESRKGMNPLNRAEPLIQFASRQKEGQFVWKLHSFLARYLYDAGKRKEASKHAEEAGKYAPEKLKKDLESLVSSQ